MDLESSNSEAECRPTVDRDARALAALLLRGLISGRVSNDEFERRMPESRDEAIWAFSDMAWLLYSDDREHKLVDDRRVDPVVRREVIRWILFLDSSKEYIWPRIRFPGQDPMHRVRKFAFLRRMLLLDGALSRAEADEFLRAGDYTAWPFATLADYKEAIRNPRRLAGRSS